ncbi:MAG: hypothetical protein Q7T21_11640 [Gallionella sp.]|nr:hypothetical protein [Gallionella sp.]
MMVMLVIMVMGAASFLVSSLSRSGLQIKRDQNTSEALAQAKEALIGYATSVNLFSGSARPGDLPCPDRNNDGVAESSCGDASGSNQSQRIGRLPWMTLGLPDLRDGSGERLWYAVSNNFKNSTRTTCTSPGQSGCLNSDTVGTITVRSSDGNIINDATSGSGVVAVIIAPGDVLQRQGGALQDRSSAGINTASNYLDIANGIDNASFTDSTTNGFIQGRIKDSNDNLIVNDQLLVISQNIIMQPLQKRVAAEVKLCLEDYASNNIGRYPWAAPITDLGLTYNDNNDEYFGRIPDNLDQTWSDSYTGWPSYTHLMSDQWGTCNTHTNNTPRAWWINWKEMVFYGVARRFRPNDTTALSFPSICEASTTNCLKVNTSNTHARFVVIVAGKKLSTPNQANRNSNKSNAFYYLEGGNESADPSIGYNLFYQASPSSSFNDMLIYQ